MKKLYRWLRPNVVPGPAAIGFVALYLVAEVGYHQWERIIRSADMIVPKAPGCFWALLFFALLNACYRVIAFHPLFRPAYFQWLQTTPWTSRLPLPLGPIHLVWQDAVVLAITALPGLFHARPYHFLIPFAFVIFYVVLLGVSFLATGQWSFGYAIAFGFGLIVRLVPDLATDENALLLNAPISATVFVLYLIAFLGLRRALAAFPWMDDREKIAAVSDSLQTQRDAKRRSPVVGWPFDRLNPQRPRFGISTGKATMISFLAAWWIYAILAQENARESEPQAGVATMRGAGWYVIFLAFTALARTFVYIRFRYWPPITLLGRVATGRWIIPGYDRVFAAPMCMVAVGVALGVVLVALRIPWHFAVPFAVFCQLWLGMCLGPTAVSWWLTGAYRLSPPVLTNESFSTT